MKAVAAAAWMLLASAPALASDWAVDMGRSVLGFSGTQVGVPFQGRFSRYDARITFDPAHPELGQASVVIDMTSARSGDAQRDEALPQADWFDAKRFTQARFEAKGFRAKGGDSFEAPGTLTLRGVSKDVVLPFTLAISGDEAHAKGRLPLVRTAFGVGQGAWSSGQYVALEVFVDVDLVAKRVPGP